jgi:hypothetical protein
MSGQPAALDLETEDASELANGKQNNHRFFAEGIGTTGFGPRFSLLYKVDMNAR